MANKSEWITWRLIRDERPGKGKHKDKGVFVGPLVIATANCKLFVGSYNTQTGDFYTPGLGKIKAVVAFAYAPAFPRVFLQRNNINLLDYIEDEDDNLENVEQEAKTEANSLTTRRKRATRI